MENEQKVEQQKNKKSNNEYQKFPDGTIPIGMKSVQFYLGIVYKELFTKKELKLVSRGDIGVSTVIAIVSDLVNNKFIQLQNNKVEILYISKIGRDNREVILPTIEVILKKI